MNKEDVTTGERLKKYRRLGHLSQEGLAEATGISIRTIQRIEKGESVGSAYTLKVLAEALHIQAKDLLPEEPLIEERHYQNRTPLKLLNLSALLVLFIPLANIIVPAIILWRNRADRTIHDDGRKILSLQILWTLCTIAMMVIVPVLLLIFQPLHGSKIPLFVPVYFICALFNAYFTIRIAISINTQSGLPASLPNIL